MSLVLFLQNLCHWLSFLQCSWSLLLRNCCCWLFFAALLFWSASSGPALTLPLCGNPTNSKAAALSESHAIEVFSFPELQRPTTQQTPTTQLLCPNLTPSKVLSKVSLSSLLQPSLLEPSWVSTWTWTCKNLPKNRHMFFQLVSTTFHLLDQFKTGTIHGRYLKKFEPQVVFPKCLWIENFQGFPCTHLFRCLGAH